MSASAAPPARSWPGDCLVCSKAAQVRHVALGPGYPKAQVCFDCRPPEEAPAPVRKFAVLVRDRYAYLIEATSQEQASGFLSDELVALGDDVEDRIIWSAGDDVVWLAAWRRGDVTLIRDRPLPKNLE